MKSFLSCAVALLLLSIPQMADAYFTFDEIKMVGADLSTIEQTEFTLDETPWLYLKLPDSPFGGPFGDLNITFSWWQGPENEVFFEGGGLSANRENWLSLDDWDIIKDVGEWNIYAKYVGLAGVGHGNTSFVVTPEPISTTLFLFGSAPMGAALYRQRGRKKSLKLT